MLEKVIVIFRYLQDKDVFENFYKTHLSKRLLGGRSVSDEVRGTSKPRAQPLFVPVVFHQTLHTIVKADKSRYGHSGGFAFVVTTRFVARQDFVGGKTPCEVFELWVITPTVEV